MSEFLKNKHKIMLVVGCFFLVVTILAGSFAHLAGGSGNGSGPVVADTDGGQDGETEEEAAPEDGQHPEEDEYVYFNMPATMRGVFLAPGVDYIKSADTSQATLEKEIDAAIASAVNLTMNTMIIDTTYEDKVIYHTASAPGFSADFDLMEYIVEQCRENGLYTYAIFDASFYSDQQRSALLSVGAGSINSLSTNLGQFAEKYKVDGILLDGYTNQASGDSYGVYSLQGGGIGFQNFMKQSPSAVVKTASETIRQRAKGTQIGLLADAVWANSDETEGGSATKAAFTALGTGNADTKGFVEDGLVDFVAVKAYGSTSDASTPFSEVVAWWSEVAGENDVPLYVVHAADKAATQETGWQGADELVKQLVALDDLSGVRGSVFNSLERLVADPGQSTTNLLKYIKEEVPAELILTQLEMTKPEQTTYTTTETVVVFTGASDPSRPVTINGETIRTDESGYFTITKELAGGVNTFTIEHKDKTISYSITRQVDILKDIAPTGEITTEGSMSVTISAWAYEDATVSAQINGSTVSMSVDDSSIDESNRDSSYKKFVGQYTVPAATASVQNLGSIVVTASWNGESKTLTGASVKVNKKTPIEDGVPVVVIADQAATYPPNTLNNIPDAGYYPLPKGAMDYAVGDELVYKKDGKTYTYYVLASGMRVEAEDIQAISGDFAAQNVISGMNVTSKDGYTYVTLKTAQKVSYSFSYSAGGVKVKFHNTVQTPGSMELSTNPMFSMATWSGGDTLELVFLKSGGFMGYKGYYDSDGNLVLRFNNPPASLSGARIAIDPGHGGSDPGTAGFLADYPEKTVNLLIAKKLQAELQSRGATVLLIDTSTKIEGPERVAKAEAFEADILVSIHNNSALNASATGTEVYYFYPFSKNLASSSSASVSSALNTTNRGAKNSYYRVTLSSQMASVLVECGFMSNKTEYEKLLKESYQQAIAKGIADSLSSAIAAAYPGSSAGGTESTGDSALPGEPDPEVSVSSSTASQASEASSSSSTAGSGPVEDVTLNYDELTLEVGSGKALKALFLPSNPANKNVTWSSSKASVATVSSSGNITAVKAGTATITATTEDGGLKATCVVTVVEKGEGEDDKGNGDSSSDNGKDSSKETQEADEDTTAGYAVTGVALADSGWFDFDTGGVTLYVKSSYQLQILNDDDKLINPADFAWKTSDTDIVTVNKYGVVTAKNKNGSATITAIPSNGEDSIACVVTVSKSKISVTDVSLNESKITINQGETYKDLKVTVTPTTATSADVNWSTKNKRIATVDSQGRITGVNAGTTTITAASSDGKKKDTVEVTVVKTSSVIDGLDLDTNQMSMYVGEESYLYVDIYPENTTATKVVWKSSNTNIVSVDQEGNLVAHKAGKATVTVTSSVDQTIEDKCFITVYDD